MSPSIAPVPSAYVREYSAGEIIRTAVDIYRAHFRPLFVLALLPLLLSCALKLAFLRIDSPASVMIAFVLDCAAGFVISAVMTVSVSDICVGNRPDIGRSYNQLFSLFGKSLVTLILSACVIAIGFLLLIVPGIIFGAWYLYGAAIVMLERLGGTDALRRSKELGKGKYLRNIGITFFFSIAMLIPAFVIGALTGLVMGLASASRRQVYLATTIEGALVTAFFEAPLLISIVLMYYDLRVRKEGFDIRRLIEDLRY